MGARRRQPGQTRVPSLLALLVLVAAAPTLAESSDGYPLDSIARVLDPGAALPCADTKLVVHRSSWLRYSRPPRVHPAFSARLSGLESLVNEVAVQFYGRPPRTLVHLGTHNCRRMRRYPDWLSEHALGNAIDLAGFDFGPAHRDQPLPVGAPRALRRGFGVRMDAHWNGRRGAAALHGQFLQELARRLIARPDLFSVVLGPAWPGHHNHLHLDRAPYRVVEVF
jgi:hypothetical protein